jgi:hypothetical protein
MSSPSRITIRSVVACAFVIWATRSMPWAPIWAVRYSVPQKSCNQQQPEHDWQREWKTKRRG